MRYFIIIIFVITSCSSIDNNRTIKSIDKEVTKIDKHINDYQSYNNLHDDQLKRYGVDLVFGYYKENEPKKVIIEFDEYFRKIVIYFHNQIPIYLVDSRSIPPHETDGTGGRDGRTFPVKIKMPGYQIYDRIYIFNWEKEDVYIVNEKDKFPESLSPQDYDEIVKEAIHLLAEEKIKAGL